MYKPVAGVERIFGGGEGQATPGEELALTTEVNRGNALAALSATNRAFAAQRVTEYQKKKAIETAKAGGRAQLASVPSPWASLAQGAISGAGEAVAGKFASGFGSAGASSTGFDSVPSDFSYDAPMPSSFYDSASEARRQLFGK